jgi:pyrimidine operon attenuation protein/uracil phosphoribosyltransferase
MATYFNSDPLHLYVEQLAERILERHGSTECLAIVGIADGGIIPAQRVAAIIGNKTARNIPCGVVNAAFHRDDIGAKPIPKAFRRTDLPFMVDDSVIILVDDVLFSGRTVRAALSELFDQGRPAIIELAVLCDRGHRVLPIQADYIGFTLDTPAEQKISLYFDETDPKLDQLTIHPL